MIDCVTTIEALLKGMLTSGLGVKQNDLSDSTIGSLTIRQVKSTDAEGNLRRVYPAKDDLVFDIDEKIHIERE